MKEREGERDSLCFCLLSVFVSVSVSASVSVRDTTKMKITLSSALVVQINLHVCVRVYECVRESVRACVGVCREEEIRPEKDLMDTVHKRLRIDDPFVSCPFSHEACMWQYTALLILCVVMAVGSGTPKGSTACA